MSDHSPRPGFAIERIGELPMRLDSKPAPIEFATVMATDFDVQIDYKYTPENREEDIDAALAILAIKADAGVHFDSEHTSVIVSRGTDLMPLFSHYQVEHLRDKLLEQLKRTS